VETTVKRAEEDTATSDGAGDLLTLDEAAQSLQLSVSAIRSYIRQGKLTGHKVVGSRKMWVLESEVRALLTPIT
jgi:excisionase family DNA binding protein